MTEPVSPPYKLPPDELNYCACGHAQHDHEIGRKAPARCQVVDCKCFAWDHDQIKDFEDQYP